MKDNRKDGGGSDSAFALNSSLVSWFTLVLILSGCTNVFSSTVISEASIQVLSDHIDIGVAIDVLQTEVFARTGNLWEESDGQESDYLVLFCHTSDVADFTETHLLDFSSKGEVSAESFELEWSESAKRVIIVYSDFRGALYGVGKLLRSARWGDSNMDMGPDNHIVSNPRYSIRGHQLGYRPKTNSYDAWAVDQFDQYMRDLAIFGANSIEIMPPRTDDDFTSRHMQIPAIDMIAEQSRICDKYDLDVWMWYPNMGSDYSHPDSIAFELKERHEVFSTVTRLDHLFVPGGDPGDVEPDVLFAWLEKVSTVLKQYHPEAKIWVSPQVFRPTGEWLDSFFDHINRRYDWLGGVVFGPWVKVPLPEIRELVDEDIPIRRYPDITHSLSSQYPVPEWDLVWASTLGRECINPRPVDQKMIHNALDQFASGSISYSEGTNDDVNKFIWSALDWDPETTVAEILREYARYFMPTADTEAVVQGMLGLENNLRGPILSNTFVPQTLRIWQQLEENAGADLRANYRFQMGLIRAYFDAYIQERAMHEHLQERKARLVLTQTKELGRTAILRADSLLDLPFKNAVALQWQQRCFDLADDLYESVGAQLTVEKHGAMAGRGNFIDNIDNPLNDIAWLRLHMDQLDKVEDWDLADQVSAFLNRTDPGPGGIYDNFGQYQLHGELQLDDDLTQDPGNLATPRVSFGVGLVGEEWVHEITATGFQGQATPLAWMHQITTLYDQPLVISYTGLSPHEKYKLRVSYTGRFRSAMKLTCDGQVIHELMETGEIPTYDFDLPYEVTKDGKCRFEWTCGEAQRGSQVSELWIMKVTDDE